MALHYPISVIKLMLRMFTISVPVIRSVLLKGTILYQGAQGELTKFLSD